MDSKLLHRVRSLVERGERISVEDCRDLFGVHDLIELAKLVQFPRERRFGKKAYYRAAHVMRYRGEHPEFFLSEVETMMPEDATEVILKCVYDKKDLLEDWKQRFRELVRFKIPITAHISPGFIARLTVNSGAEMEAVIEGMRESIPIFITGEEAEVFDAEYRSDFGERLITPEWWLAVHQTAHRLGLKTGAAMTYSVEERPEMYAKHMEMIRRLQDESGGFIQFTPAALHKHNSDARYLATPSSVQSLRMLALSRLFFDNIDHIVTSPSLITAEVAYIALSYGTDTIDGSITPDDVHSVNGMEEASAELNIVDAGTGKVQVATTVSEIRGRIKEARWVPFAVNTAYEEQEVMVEPEEVPVFFAKG